VVVGGVSGSRDVVGGELSAEGLVGVVEAARVLLALVDELAELLKLILMTKDDHRVHPLAVREVVQLRELVRLSARRGRKYEGSRTGTAAGSDSALTAMSYKRSIVATRQAKGLVQARGGVGGTDFAAATSSPSYTTPRSLKQPEEQQEWLTQH
jgi:hypothetical protein